MLENFKVFKTTIGGKEVIVEVGKYAQQANGSCVIRCGETVVMVTVETGEENVFAKEVKSDEKES